MTKRFNIMYKPKYGCKKNVKLTKQIWARTRTNAKKYPIIIYRKKNANDKSAISTPNLLFIDFSNTKLL